MKISEIYRPKLKEKRQNRQVFRDMNEAVRIGLHELTK
jgi:hypothetical protein